MLVYRCNNCQGVSPNGLALTCPRCGKRDTIRAMGETYAAPVRRVRCPKCSSKNYDSDTKTCPDCQKKNKKRVV